MKYFGTDGIRQPAKDFTPTFLAKIVKGLIDYAGDDIKVMLAGDTRESTEWILQDLGQALESLGIDYSNAGILPTPAINYCFYQMGFDFAIDVTASHNPYSDNGIKIFERSATSGQKLCQAGCDKIEAALNTDQTFTLVSTSLEDDIHDEALEIYIAHLLQYLGDDTNLHGLRLALDCANGATSVINKQLFEQLGAKVTLLHAEEKFNTKINQDCGSTHLESLQKTITKRHLDFGVAYDGDGDRCLLIDHACEIVDGDQIIAILADFLKLDSIAVTVMANQGLLNWADSNHIHTEITPVGDSNVAAAMREHHIQLGGEQSGHIILPNEPTGDGILTSLMIAKAIATTQKSLNDLATIFTKSPQVTINLPVSPAQKQALKESESAKQILLAYQQKLSTKNGRLLVRPSGTEPLIRITAWGDDESTIAQIAEELKAKLKEAL